MACSAPFEMWLCSGTRGRLRSGARRVSGTLRAPLHLAPRLHPGANRSPSHKVGRLRKSPTGENTLFCQFAVEEVEPILSPEQFVLVRRRSARRTRRGRSPPASARRNAPRCPGLARARRARAGRARIRAAIAASVAASAMSRSCSQIARPTAPVSASACGVPGLARGEDPVRGEVAVDRKELGLDVDRHAQELATSAAARPAGRPAAAARASTAAARPTPERPRPG